MLFVLVSMPILKLCLSSGKFRKIVATWEASVVEHAKFMGYKFKAPMGEPH